MTKNKTQIIKKSKFKRKDPKDLLNKNPKNTIIKKKKRKRKSPKRKDELKTANLIKKITKTKKASSYHIVNKNPKKNGAGRQDKLTPKTQKTLLGAIRSGMRLNRAFKLAGISNVTYYGWMESGKLEADRIKNEINIQRKIAIDNNELNPRKVQDNENWINDKIEELEPNKYFNFLIEVERHNAKCEMDNLNCILNARDGGQYLTEEIKEYDSENNLIRKAEVKKYQKPNWKAARWLLKITNPDIYSDRQILAHEGEIQNNTNVEHSHTITLDESTDNIAGVLGLLIQTGFIKGKLIEHSEPEPGIKQVTDTQNN